MGRLINYDINNEIITNTITGNTNKNVYIFTDDSGNVTQIKKQYKDRLKYYIDPNLPQNNIIVSCAIGINDPFAEDCTEGQALGLGDNLLGYAIYS